MSDHFPDFAAALRQEKLRFVTKDINTFLRLSRKPNTEPYWGKSRRYRFDDPLMQFGVTYVAEELDVAFAETIIHETACFEDGAWVVPWEQIDGRSIVYYAGAKTALTLLDLTGISLKLLGLNNDLSAASDYAFTQELSRAVYENVPEADGIYYVSRQLNTKFAAALFERSGAECQSRWTCLEAHPDYSGLLAAFGVEIVYSGA